MPLHWEQNPLIPRAAGFLLGALRFSSDRRQVPDFSESEWKSALYYCDRNQLTLLLRSRADWPADVQHRLDDNLTRNIARISRIKQTYWNVAEALDAARITSVVLKGFANWERYSPDPASRLQYDLDLYCPDEAIRARDAILRLGYESIPGSEEFPIDHLPALIRKSGWQWHGDFFDPEIPISIEVHFRLWDETTEGFAAPGVEDFWARRVSQTLDGRAFLALHPADSLGYAALHLLRHWLRGDMRAANVYELAYFLDTQAANEDFWTNWSNLHNPELRRLQALCFRLAADWFDCRMSPVARTEVDSLPSRIRRWFEDYAASPAAAFFRPNKDELALHLCLLDSFRKKSVVIRRRLLPTRLPGPLDSVLIPE